MPVSVVWANRIADKAAVLWMEAKGRLAQCQVYPGLAAVPAAQDTAAAKVWGLRVSGINGQPAWVGAYSTRG
jgi:hypothetical protein